METKYESIVEFFAKEIMNKKLKPGCKLPSIRDICKDFGCSSTTAIRAYTEIERRHMIYSKPKSGFYVLESSQSKTINKSAGNINFSIIWPDTTTLPYIEIQNCFNQAINVYNDSLFSTTDPQGFLSLRKVVEKHLYNYQIFETANNIFITSGSQQALSILANMPFPNCKENVLVEQPTYSGMLKILELNNITTIGIERHNKGLDFDRLEVIFRSGNIKFFYTMPRFHNPTGFSYSNDEKKHILKLAQKYDVYIVEDDYLCDLETGGKSCPMYALDTSARTIYIKSFSKTLLPGLRTGIMVLPNLLTNKFKVFKWCSDISTSVLSQGALEIFINSGMYDEHVKKIKRFYTERMNILKQACDEKMPAEVKCHIPKSGFCMYVELPVNCKVENLIYKLRNKEIYIFDLAGSFLQEFRKQNVFSLTICRAENSKISEGINIIGSELLNIIGKNSFEEFINMP